MALLMLFIAAGLCLSQGLALVLCHCSGHVFVGSAPEVCCEDCGPAEPACMVAEVEGAPVGCGVQGNCYEILARGWDKFTPASSREMAPAPLVADAVAPIDQFSLLMMSGPVVGLAEKFSNRPEPPGRPHALLYGSLRI
jgi:hypothetical protein